MTPSAENQRVRWKREMAEGLEPSGKKAVLLSELQWARTRETIWFRLRYRTYKGWNVDVEAKVSDVVEVQLRLRGLAV